MNKAYDIKNPYEIPRVVLAAISDEIQLDENLEPPFVRVRDTNSQYLHLDTSNSSLFTTPAATNIILNRSMPRVNRIEMSFFAFRNFSPNINPRNNRFDFIRSGIMYTAIIPPDQDLVGILRYDALASAMSTAVGVPGEFVASVLTVFPTTYAIANTGLNLFRFDNNLSSVGVRYGRYLWGFNETNYGVGTDLITHSLTSYQESYTRYIDITSYELTQYTKIDTAGVNIPAECLFRFFMTDATYGQSMFVGFTKAPSLNYDRSRAIVSIDLNILDEFGQLLYIPESLWGSFVLYIVLIASM
jgi:hypothetical protein